MWKFTIICLALVAASCANTKSNPEKSADIQGQWLIENVVESDTSYVRPSEIEPGMSSYIDFRNDNTFGIMTNCNHIGGEYTQENESIKLTNISSTEMACDNMSLEEILKRVLPTVSSIDCINDSITRLNTNKDGSYIVIHKCAMSMKAQ